MTNVPVTSHPSTSAPHVVVIGGGFGGLKAAKALAKAPVRITLIDKRNFHLFQPLLYQVATATLPPSDIAYPIRSLFRDQPNTTVLLDEVTAVDLATRTVHLRASDLAFDYLIVAAGSAGTHFGHDEWIPFAPGIKTMEDALDTRQRVLSAFEAAERTTDLTERDALLTFVIVGGGPTGVELAGALAEISHQTLRQNFRTFDPATARIILIEGGEALLKGYPARLQQTARRSLEQLGVEVRTGLRVTDIDNRQVVVGDKSIPTHTVLWGAGVTAQPIGATLGVPLDAACRVLVDPTLQVPGHPQVYVVGDLAAFDDGHGGTLPGVAQVAMQGGVQAAKNIIRQLKGQRPQAFHYRDKGTMATIGWNRAVAEIGPLRLSGFPAWFTWATIHIAFRIGYRSRFSVMWQWMWAYITRNRSARLIIGHTLPGRTAGDTLRPDRWVPKV